MKPKKILIIEDVPAVVETISLALEIRWPEAKIIATSRGEEGIKLTKTDSLDVIILDLGLPDITGFDVLKNIRLFSEIPILVLTVRSEEADIVKCLEWGADDYMIKPFKQLELLARLQGILRRSVSQIEEPLVWGQLRLNPGATTRLISGSTEIQITYTQGLILELLMKNGGNVVSHSAIAEKMWGITFPDSKDSVKVHIRRLREKLELDPSNPKLILTKPGIGYFLAKPL